MVVLNTGLMMVQIPLGLDLNKVDSQSNHPIKQNTQIKNQF